jgi:hypothetical protein
MDGSDWLGLGQGRGGFHLECMYPGGGRDVPQRRLVLVSKAAGMGRPGSPQLVLSSQEVEGPPSTFLALPPTCSVILSWLLPFSKPQFPHQDDLEGLSRL